MNIISALPKFVILVFSIVIHEVAHGQVALSRGDTTARDAGRLTLNPLPHIDPFGTILFPLILLLFGSPFLFGWARPVPVNPWRLNQAKKDMAYVGAAGPLSNIILALACAVILKLLFRFAAPGALIVESLQYGIMINLVLAVFNLMPVPPLDGSRIAMAVMPSDMAQKYIQLERYGMLIVFALFLTGVFRFILSLVVPVLLYVIDRLTFFL